MRPMWLLICIFVSSVLPAAEPEDLAQQFDKTVKPFLSLYCVDCHSGDDPEAGVNLQLKQAPDLALHLDEWTSVLQKVGGHEMPPEDTEQPSDQEREAFVNWVNAGLADFDCTKGEVKPRSTVRRLNRSEYNNVVQDLFGINVSPADDFPADDVGEGFDNIGEVLSLPPLLMEKYLDAAEKVTNALVADTEAWNHCFGEITVEGDAERDVIAKRIGTLARSALRRPLQEGELDRLMKLYDVALAQDVTTGRAIEFVTQAILVSPQFLFRLEEDPLAKHAEPKPLDSHAIASRLSFFLWSSIPDAELNALADEGKLASAEVVAAQARRMLGDPKSRRFVDNFAGQWLELRLLNQVKPNPDQFPAFDEALRSAMVEETSRFFYELMQADGNILDLIDSDYTFVNDRLATFYGIDGIKGSEFQRVALKDDQRGGILTHASILTLTSNPTRTSPVKRGKWILENILGTPPPPPPPNVPELGEGDELLGTLRERMQQHRENPSCAVCHRKMDALGFGFENFDAIGGWRDKDGRYEIDPSGELPGKITFKKPAELRKILRTNSREFTSCLTKKLLTYALGRALSSRDKCLIDDIVIDVESHDHRFSELIVAIVISDAFRFSGS